MVKRRKSEIETINPKWNKDLTFIIQSKKQKGKIKSEIYIRDNKRNEERFYTSFESKNKKEYKNKISGINKNRGATIKGSKKGESFSLVGTEYGDISITKYKVRHTETTSKRHVDTPQKNQQIWIRAEVYYAKQNRPNKLNYAGSYYGYSKMGGTEQEAIGHIYGQVRTDYHLGSGDTIVIDRITGKGVMGYDR